MPRAIWSGSISFGLVNVPVEIRGLLQRSEEIHFSLLDRRDSSPIGYEKINKSTGKPVAREDIVRGYEFEDRRFVVLTDEEIDAANVEASHSMDIAAFVKLDEIEPTYFETPYLVAPTKQGMKAYALLVRALAESERVGIAKLVLHTKEHLAALMSRDGLLLVEILRFAHEVPKLASVDAPRSEISKVKVSDQELKLASQLIDGMTKKWSPDEFRDEYRRDVLALIEKKVKAESQGRHFVVSPKPAAKKRGGVIDLISVLKESVEASKRPAKAKSAHRRMSA